MTHSPERALDPESLKDKQGYWTPYDYNIAVIAYNSRLVSAGEVPRKYEDFLDPKWKGNFALDQDPDKSIMGWLKTWGTERTQKYLQGISKNDVVVRKGHTLLTQLLCAGEFKAGIDLYAYRLADLKNTKGCPVEISYTDPTPAAPSPLVVAKKSPRPDSDALLMDYSALRAGTKNSRGVRPTLGSSRRAADLSDSLTRRRKRCAGVAADSRRCGATGEALPAAARGVFAETVSGRGLTDKSWAEIENELFEQQFSLREVRHG